MLILMYSVVVFLCRAVGAFQLMWVTY